MAWSLILVLCVPFALLLMAWLFYLKRDSLAHWEFSLSIFKGIRFSADFIPPAKTNIFLQTGKNTPLIANHLLQTSDAEQDIAQTAQRGATDVDKKRVP